MNHAFNQRERIPTSRVHQIRAVMNCHATSQTILILSQVYVPDPASVGQHMHDAAAELVRRGFRVVVFTARRGYDDPSKRYPKCEEIDGVHVRRLSFSSFGKKSIPIRLLGGGLFVLQAALRGLFVGELRGVLVSTSPPFAPLGAGLIRLLRRVPFSYWAMDLNPDQAIAMGKTSPRSLFARLFEALNRFTLRRAGRVIALDRFMGRRLEARQPIGDRLSIIPPWPHQQHLESVDHAQNPFRQAHGLADQFVIMFSGNISPSHPLSTVLEAAEQMQDHADLLFLFIGGGLGKQQIEQFVEARTLTNVRTLAYQPIDQIKFSLSAADVHLVSMGQEMVGIVHPCKAYGAMAVKRPLLLLGPANSHVGEMIEQFGIGWRVDHGDVDGAIRTINAIRQTNAGDLSALGEAAHRTIAEHYSEAKLTSQFADALERMLDAPSGDSEQLYEPGAHAKPRESSSGSP